MDNLLFLPSVFAPYLMLYMMNESIVWLLPPFPLSIFQGRVFRLSCFLVALFCALMHPFKLDVNFKSLDFFFLNLGF